MQRLDRRRAQRGLSLMEMLVYIAIVGMSISLIQRVMVHRYEATQHALRADNSVRGLAKLERRLRDDIAQAQSMAQDGGGELTLFDGSQVVWEADRAGRLVRRSDGAERSGWLLHSRRATVDERGLVTLELELSREALIGDPKRVLHVVELLGGKR